MLIRVTYSTIDRFRETRRFKTLEGARKYAHRRVGEAPDIGWTFGYAVSNDGIGKITVSGDATIGNLFPKSAWHDSSDI